tara:strand:- start:532 stop:1302 length:771 start_codon:yes stop_codon:yes gene_type:complete
MSKVIKGRGKILFHDEKDREIMNKKYPEIKFEKMNPLIFTTTYKGNKQFEVEIQVEDTKIPCAFNKWAWPWKYGTKVELRIQFKDLKKKATIHITGGIQHELFQFFRYDYEKMIKDDKKLNTKVSKKKENKSKLTTKQKRKPLIIMVDYSKGRKTIRKVYNIDKLSSKQKKKTQKGGRASADLLTKLQIKNMQRLKQCESKAKNKSQKKKCLNEFNKRWSDYSKFLNKKSIRKGRNYADRKQYTPKQQREIIKQFF